ncbi:MAG: hypothetical protein OMOMHJEC_02253 [Xanthomonadales bacterium]|nr:hypothetical protein [Xanthomonadales bacterium]
MQPRQSLLAVDISSHSIPHRPIAARSLLPHAQQRRVIDVCHVHDPQQVIERIATAMSETLSAHSERIDRSFLRQLASEWDDGRLSVALKS